MEDGRCSSAGAIRLDAKGSNGGGEHGVVTHEHHELDDLLRREKPFERCKSLVVEITLLVKLVHRSNHDQF